MLVVWIDDVWYIRSENPSFVSSYFAESVSKKGLVITCDLSYDGNAVVVEDVGGIQLAAHAYLNNADLDLGLLERCEGCGREDLERRGIDVFFLVELDEVIFYSLEMFFVNGFAIDLYRIPPTLRLVRYGGTHVTCYIPIYEMWRIECACTDGSALQKCRCVVADGSFAISACNMNGFPWALDIFEQKTYALQPRLNHVRPTSVMIASMWFVACQIEQFEVRLQKS
jgi:hypothetical protein